ncbi:hypothetical protein VPH35_130773 [Triticum aestivum]
MGTPSSFAPTPPPSAPHWQPRCRIDVPPSFSVGTDYVDLPSTGSAAPASPTSPTSSPTTLPASLSLCQGRPRRLTATCTPACGRQEELHSHHAGQRKKSNLKKCREELQLHVVGWFRGRSGWARRLICRGRLLGTSDLADGY